MISVLFLSGGEFVLSDESLRRMNFGACLHAYGPVGCIYRESRPPQTKSEAAVQSGLTHGMRLYGHV